VRRYASDSRSAEPPSEMGAKANIRHEGSLLMCTRKSGRCRRERRGFGDEYRGVDGLRELRGNARRLGWNPAGICFRSRGQCYL
jgi:hypothetical protein